MGEREGERKGKERRHTARLPHLCAHGGTAMNDDSVNGNSLARAHQAMVTLGHLAQLDLLQGPEIGAAVGQQADSNRRRGRGGEKGLEIPPRLDRELLLDHVGAREEDEKQCPLGRAAEGDGAEGRERHEDVDVDAGRGGREGEVGEGGGEGKRP